MSLTPLCTDSIHSELLNILWLFFYIGGSMKSNLSCIYRGVILFSRWALRFLLKGRVYGLENIPRQGGFIIAGNHVSYLDPPLIACQIPRQPIFSMARNTLFGPPLKWLFGALNIVPIDRENGADLKAIKNVLRILREGHPLLMFPEGTRSPTGVLQRPKKGIGLIAAKAQVPIVPVRILGTYEVLPKGRRWPSRHRVTLMFGPPIHFSQFQNTSAKDLYLAIGIHVMKAIAQLSPEVFSISPEQNKNSP
jgi:1-acyl-sn-glycerol-3-phosphate acyltransferase